MVGFSNDLININVRCRFCGQISILTVHEKDFRRYQSGNHLIQNVFPYLSAEERELLISKMCGVCWAKTFSPIEEL